MGSIHPQILPAACCCKVLLLLLLFSHRNSSPEIEFVVTGQAPKTLRVEEHLGKKMQRKYYSTTVYRYATLVPAARAAVLQFCPQCGIGVLNSFFCPLRGFQTETKLENG